ncbi:MAG: flavodoxin family protein [Ilumatobacteraceae bacterium]
MEGMKAAILIESLTGNTWKAGELIAANLQQEGWSITGFSAVKTPDHASIQEADTVIVGTWVHGLFVVGQAPWAIDRLRALPAMSGKKAVAFCTFALNPGKSLDVMTNTLLSRGADVVGGLGLHRGKLAEHSEEFAVRLVDSVSAK